MTHATLSFLAAHSFDTHMKLALLGADDAMLTIARRALERGLHEIVLLTEQDVTGQEVESMARLRTLLPGRAEIAWETLLYGHPVDAVLVARGSDQELRADQLRKLVQAAMSLLVSHPVLDSMLVYYELDMIRRESGCVMLANMPWRWHPAAAQLAALIAAGEQSPIGAIGQAVFERSLSRRDRSAVLVQFARDVDLIRATCGDVTKLSALGSPTDELTYENLGVQMSGPGSIAVRWSVGPVEESPRGILTIVGTRGKAILHMPENDAWRLETRSDGLSETESFQKWDDSAAALEELTAAIEGEPPAADWNDAARSVELAEAIDRSLAKGRTIELHNEDFTDIGTFKGTMTSLGCGLLLAGLCLLFVVGVVEVVARKAGFAKLADALWSWPYWLVGFLVVFLLLQLVLKLAAPGDSGKREADDQSTP
jgi:predicted dehydrogenase